MQVKRCKVCGFVHLGEAPETCPMCGAGAIAFVDYEVPELLGTKTFENLMAAFAGESQANRKYTLFQEIARLEGAPDSAVAAFERPKAEETAHALSHLIYAGGFGSTLDNLTAAAEGEGYEHDIMYAEFAATAEAEGLPELAHYFKMVGKFENEHKAGYLEAIEDLKNA